MTRAQALGLVRVDDLVMGIGAGGQEKLLLVYQVDSLGFSARHVTTQMTFRFDRHGKTRIYEDGGHIIIVSTAPLPPAMRDAALGLDRKFAGRPEYPESILSKAEIRLLLTYKDSFNAQLLPPD